jgi:hypothetical protein
MMGHRQVEQAALFYEFSLERHVPADHPGALYRQVRRVGGCEAGAGSILQRDGPAID